MSTSDDQIQAILNKIKSGNAVDTSTQQKNAPFGLHDDKYQPPSNASLYGGAGDSPGTPRPYSGSPAGMVRGTADFIAGGRKFYMPGDELKLLQTPELVPETQLDLVRAGLLDIKQIRVGVWDQKSQAAYKQVLGIANQNGMTAAEALKLLVANPTIGDQLGPSRAANVIHETSPLDIAATAQATAQKLLGRNLTDEELKPFVAQVQSQERTADTKTYKLGAQDGKGGVVVSAPTAESGYGAEDYYKKNYLPEVVGYAAVQRMNDFYSLLGGNG